MPFDENTHRIGLPVRPFLYTVDQLATVLSITERALHVSHLYHVGRDIGIKRSEQMEARNIAPADEKPDWRVAELELKRWMRSKGFKYYDRGTVTK